MAAPDPTVLQVGCGGFGPTHVLAWQRLGLGNSLLVADPDPLARAAAARLGLAEERLLADHRDGLERADVVDVVAATDRHVEICLAALRAGKDVFCEKPLTLDVAGARAVAETVSASGRVLQVGYYFRHHPLARFARARLAEGALGRLRHASAAFTGFKRARRDSGALGNDAIHFLDLLQWLVGEPPSRVYAITRDHFGRGFDDLALVVLSHPSGLVARIEAGWVQPGRWADTIVPGAQATKEMTIAGASGALEIDFHAERLIWHRVRHERAADGLFRPLFEDALMPHHRPMSPVEIVASQLETFLDHVRARTAPAADVWRCGVALAELCEAIRRSAACGEAVALAAKAGP